MNVCFFHGLESDGPGRKGGHLAGLGWSLYAPTIDYRHPSNVSAVWTEALAKPRDAFVGSSMGGWMATLLATQTGTPAWLVNPAVIGRTIEPKFPEGLGLHRPKVHVLLGRQDDLINPFKAKKWLEHNGFQVTVKWVDEGHRIEPAAFKAWIDEIGGEEKGNQDDLL